MDYSFKYTEEENNKTEKSYQIKLAARLSRKMDKNKQINTSIITLTNLNVKILICLSNSFYPLKVEFLIHLCR